MELWRVEQRSFMNMPLPTEMFDEILDRVGPRIAKQHTFWRAPLDQGMKLAINLRHLASGTKYLTLFLLICEATKLLGFLEMVDFWDKAEDWLGLLALLWPRPSVPPASNKPSSCESWTSAASGSVVGQLDLLSVLTCMFWAATDSGRRRFLKLVFCDHYPSPCQHFSTFPLVAYLTCISNERKNCVTKFRFDRLFICTFSIMWPIQMCSTYVQRLFYPFLTSYMFVLSSVGPLLILLIHYVSCTRSVFVRSLCVLCVSYFDRGCLGELEFWFSPPDNNGWFN